MKDFEEILKNAREIEKMISEIIDATTISNIIEFISLIFVIVGGIFALVQWTKGNIYKRGEIVETLIATVRDDEDVSTIMDIIDWHKGFCYCKAKFHIISKYYRKTLKGISDDELFKKIDRTLSHFSYICYLKKEHTLTNKEMKIFEYEIRRLCDNKHIVNYLYSLHHWSASLGVSMPYSFLVDYCIKKGYISTEFKGLNTKKYEAQLGLFGDYEIKMKAKEETIINKFKDLFKRSKTVRITKVQIVDLKKQSEEYGDRENAEKTFIYK